MIERGNGNLSQCCILSNQYKYKLEIESQRRRETKTNDSNHYDDQV